MLQIAICDDEQAERLWLHEWLEKYYSEQNITCKISEYACGEDLCAVCFKEENLYDLVFLDIYMGGMNGIETATALCRQGTQAEIVFLTTSPDFALASYEVAAFSYLLKPVSHEKLSAVMEKFLHSYRPHSILLQGRLYILADIVSVESRNKKVIFRFCDKSTAEIIEKLDAVQEKLAGRNFLRCHQSFIVNMDYVKSVSDCSFITSIGTEVFIRKREFAAIRKEYYDYLISI